MGRPTTSSGRIAAGRKQKVIVKDLSTKKCIYKTSFSSLFQEWLTTDEAKETAKGFENSFLLPYPKQPVEVEVRLYSYQRQITASVKHMVKPDDILIHKRGTSHVNPHRYVHRSGNEQQCIDVAILAEGYTEQEMDVFYRDAEETCKSLLLAQTVQSMKNKFNIVAVAAPSTDSGVSVPRENLWKKTAVHSHFDTFYSERYLTTSRVKSIHNALAGIPVRAHHYFSQYRRLRRRRNLQFIHPYHSTSSHVQARGSA